jgi:alkaline phosphatase
MAGTRLDRRAVLIEGSLFLTGAAVAGTALRAEEQSVPRVRVGLVADLHHADKPPAASRHYRDTLAKWAAAAEQLAREKVECLVALGDLIDSADSLAAEKDYLRTIRREMAAAPGEPRFVLGNHCVSALTKPEFLDIVAQERSYDSFDLGGCHFIVLDACFRGDGEPYGRENFHWTDSSIPAEEIEWLRADLQRAESPTIVFVHQRLDADPPYGVKNAAEVRKLLEESGRVLAVLQGHFHAGDYRELGGIHYCTLAAMIEGPGLENSAYAVLDVLPGGAIRLGGFAKQPSYRWG